MSDCETTALLKELINRESVTPNDGGCLDLLGARLAAAGFNVERLPAGDVDNLWACNGETPRLLFVGHVDVVPAGDLQQWQTPPFEAQETNGFVVGRGAADMKAGVAAMTVAACGAAAAGKKGIAVFLTSDEEGAAIYGSRFFVDRWQKQNKPPIDFCVVGEPTCERVFGDSIKIGRRGSLTGRAIVRGAQAHVAYANRGANAAHLLAEVLSRLARQHEEGARQQAAGKMATTFQVVDLRAGVGADNVTPPVARAVFNFRHTPEDTAEKLRAQSEAVFNAVAKGQWQCEWDHSAEPFLMAAGGELPAAMRAAIAQHTGQTPAFTCSGGSSDGRFFRHICRQMAEFGTLNHTIHEPNERVCKADAQTLAKIYEDIAARLL